MGVDSGETAGGCAAAPAAAALQSRRAALAARMQRVCDIVTRELGAAAREQLRLCAAAEEHDQTEAAWHAAQQDFRGSEALAAAALAYDQRGCPRCTLRQPRHAEAAFNQPSGVVEGMQQPAVQQRCGGCGVWIANARRSEGAVLKAVQEEEAARERDDYAAEVRRRVDEFSDQKDAIQAVCYKLRRELERVARVADGSCSGSHITGGPVSKATADGEPLRTEAAHGTVRPSAVMMP
eukprot:TRINITY_DN26207_c0_g1_i1.p2 TRINITY_DN26207_c0_g1~~TRINITY_DN26207_c0_g1_i1.p2  ORF type:complete len:267 (+),score=80.11 TRINITY_DN26207_c0_g1_i1:92-802(+)